jgi:hypothetical protein
MGQQVRVRPNLNYLKLIGVRMCKYDGKEAERMRRGDFAFFAAVSAPDAEGNKLRTITDWLNWVRQTSAAITLSVYPN